MESKVGYTENPPSYTPPAPSQYQTAYPAPAPGQAPYPPPVQQQYPPLSQNPPPATGQSPYGQQYGYNQQAAGYPPQQGYGAPQYAPSAGAQQQQQVVVVGAGQQQPVVVRYAQSFAGHMVFSCLVCWFCNPLFGFIAFILAVAASGDAVSDPANARRLGHASIGMSIAGSVLGVVAFIIIGVMISRSACPYTYNGTCYNHKTTYYSYSTCSGVTDGYYCYYNSNA